MEATEVNLSGSDLDNVSSVDRPLMSHDCFRYLVNRVTATAHFTAGDISYISLSPALCCELGLNLYLFCFGL